MRKALGLLFTMSLLIPIGALAGAPAGAAAAKGPTCKTFTATLTTSPALPILGSAAKVNATVKTTGKLGGCSGGPVAGVTSAVITASYKYNGNCTTLLTGKGGKTTPGPSTLTWSNKKTSTTLTTTTIIGKVTAVPLMLKLVTKITKGQYVGAVSTGTVKSVSPTGSCTKIPGAKTTLTGGATTFK